MGTKWRGLLALVNEPTADGRRFKTLTWRTLPLGLKWQRVDAMGHDDSVVVGSLETANVGTTSEAVEAGWISPELAAESKLAADAVGLWGAGELFDDIDAEQMPRLAQDVAEATTLLDKRVISPSIDAIAVGAVMWVEPGEDEPPSAERMDELFEEFMESGIEPPMEMLFAEGLVAAATLVVTPAFSEVRPFETFAAGGDVEAEEEPAEQAAATQRALALTAAAPPRPPADLFDDPGFTGYTEIHVTERADGLLQVAGHFAPRSACHLAFRDTCVTPPTSEAAYIPFHRSVLELADGSLLGVGRITTGFGKVGTGCQHEACRRGKDDHACEDMTLAAAVAHHDQQTPLAWVRAGEDEHGLYVVGVADADLSAEGRRLLEGRKFSGDWREHGASLELVELLALAKGAPAFPAPRGYARAGRLSSLIASFRPPADQPAGSSHRRQFARSVADMVVADLRAAGFVPSSPESAALDAVEQAAVTAAATEHTGAMIALVPSAADAERLAVEGGEPVTDLHLTLAYLGEADAIDDDTRAAILDRMTALAATWTEEGATLPVPADGFSVSVFNPGTANDRETCIVVGVSGEVVDAVHTDVETALGEVFAGPDQHAPWHAHLTLLYGDDLSIVEEVAEAKVGPITFDRLRVAFAGHNTDIPLGTATEPTEGEQAAAAFAALTATLDEVDAHARGLEASRLMRELRELEADVVRV